MAENTGNLKAAVGFISVVNDSVKGLFGGYLILNPAGRPVEFHCTAPVKPNRAQEILYGPTLEPYLYGEQIAYTLIERSKITPQIVCTDQRSVLCVRSLVSMPVILVENIQENGGNTSAEMFTSDTDRTGTFRWHKNCLTTAPTATDDAQMVAACLRQLLIEYDLMEPFTRIRDAIAEASK